MRVAFSNMALNTGANSPCDELMTLRTSLVAVCCCSDFGKIVGALAKLVEQARVLDGDDGLGGEARHQLDLLVGEGAHLPVKNQDHADELVRLDHRDGDHSSRTREPGHLSTGRP